MDMILLPPCLSLSFKGIITISHSPILSRSFAIVCTYLRHGYSFIQPFTWVPSNCNMQHQISNLEIRISVFFLISAVSLHSEE